MDKHQAFYEKASECLVGGICSSARINKAINRPFFVHRGRGSKLYDLNDREYIDLHSSFGASLLGYNHPTVRKWIERALDLGVICAHETEYQSQLAKEICRVIPCAELVRFTGSGTETTMHAIRLAREFTGKEMIVKFEGHYHGCHDYVMFNWFPSLESLGNVTDIRKEVESGGIPKDIEQYIIVLPFNNLSVLEKILREKKDKIAAVIVEPINYNSGCVIPSKDYMLAMRELTERYDIILLFDEILSGFRMGPGGGQEYLGVTPDLCTLGKCLGGGTTLSAFCGRKEIMEHITPLGSSFHSGTYNGHLIPIMGGLAFMEEITNPDFYDHIFALGDQLYKGIEDIITHTKVKARVQGLGARFGIYFGIDEKVTDYRIAARQDRKLFLKFVAAVLKRGVYFHTGWHHGFSSVHTVEDIDRALEGIEGAFREIA